MFSGFMASDVRLFKHAELFLSSRNEASGDVVCVRICGCKGVCIR